MHHTVVDGIRIAYDDLGARDAQGPAFLLLPGWCTDRTVFAPLAERLATFGRTLVMDWAGHGDSERPVRDFGAADLLAQARGVMADSGVEQVIPITVSHAGWVALELRRALKEVNSQRLQCGKDRFGYGCQRYCPVGQESAGVSSRRQDSAESLFLHLIKRRKSCRQGINRSTRRPISINRSKQPGRKVSLIHWPAFHCCQHRFYKE